MGHPRIKANGCKYKEKDRRLKEIFINRISDKHIMIEIIKELTVIKNTNEIMKDKYSAGPKHRGTRSPKAIP